MKEVIKCSISGVAFTLDTDAYQILNEYLKTLKNSYKDNPDGPEIVADIEARIAELILSAQDNTHVAERPLILNIISQMGSPEDISDHDCSQGPSSSEDRFPRRLYRDTQNAKLGGVCAGIAKYFDVDPTWVRLALFAPLLLILFSWVPFMHWTASIMGNMFGIFVICYLIMWFAVPAARSARQKLEMSGEKITAQSIRDTSETNCDADRRAKPIVAEAVSVFGKMILVIMKIILGFIVFGLIIAACALIIAILAITVSGTDILPIEFASPWLPILGILVALIPVGMLIYVFMCMIASRQPSGKTILGIFFLWLTTIIVCSCIAVNEHMAGKMQYRHRTIDRIMKTDLVIDGDSTTVEQLFEEEDIEAILDDDAKILRISVPNKKINITVGKEKATISVEKNPLIQQPTTSVSDGSTTEVAPSKKAGE